LDHFFLLRLDLIVGEEFVTSREGQIVVVVEDPTGRRWKTQENNLLP